MPLVIEDGTGSNPEANSYAGAEDLRTYAEARGVDLSGLSDGEIDVLLVKAMDYLEGQGSRYKGWPTNAGQPLQWPRADVWNIDGRGDLLPSSEIPRELVYGQMALAIEAQAADLQPSTAVNQSGPVTEKRVEGAVTVRYAEPVKQQYTPAFAKANALLAPLLKNNGLSLIRV